MLGCVCVCFAHTHIHAKVHFKSPPLSYYHFLYRSLTEPETYSSERLNGQLSLGLSLSLLMSLIGVMPLCLDFMCLI